MGAMAPIFYIYENFRMESIQSWTYNDFLTYLFILGATADLEISDEEKEGIIKKFGAEEYKRIKRHFDQQNDAQHIETVSALYHKFESQIGGKENLVKELRNAILTDHTKEHVMEAYLIKMLQRML
jgi:hypothetical protein